MSGEEMYEIGVLMGQVMEKLAQIEKKFDSLQDLLDQEEDDEDEDEEF